MISDTRPRIRTKAPDAASYLRSPARKKPVRPAARARSVGLQRLPARGASCAREWPIVSRTEPSGPAVMTAISSPTVNVCGPAVRDPSTMVTRESSLPKTSNCSRRSGNWPVKGAPCVACRTSTRRPARAAAIQIGSAASTDDRYPDCCSRMVCPDAGSTGASLPGTPCTRGGAPVQRVACAAAVSEGHTESRPSAAAPSAAIRAKAGALPSAMNRSTSQSAPPSSETSTTRRPSGADDVGGVVPHTAAKTISAAAVVLCRISMPRRLRCLRASNAAQPRRSVTRRSA
jgi:hypothetical protein